MKITKRTFEEDQKLQEFARTPREKKPQYNWGSLVDPARWNSTNILVGGNGMGETAFDIEEVADTIGNALTNLLLSREEQDIFNEKNQTFVVRITNLVAERLEKELASGGSIILSRQDLHYLIEKALVENEAFDVAKSLLFANKIEDGSGGLEDDEGTGIQLRLIRRNGKVVPWNEAKIEVAIRKAFLSLERDSEPAVRLAREVTRSMLMLGQEFVNIEDVQDRVQEILMRSSHYKVAETYFLYRARRTHDREAEIHDRAPQ